MPISEAVARQIEGSSWIRRMFEEAETLRRGPGGERVCDFTLGNPRIDPPEGFREALIEVARAAIPGKHGYMSNAGHEEARSAVAGTLRGEQGVPVEAAQVVITCGAAGAMNVALKTLLNPGDEVLVSAPYFMEYGAYVSNHGGRLRPVPCREDFDLDVEALAAAVTPSTAALVVNSPNNPTGRVYPERTVRRLGAMLEARSREVGRTVYLLSDEPYRKLVYDGGRVPSIMAACRNSIVLSSYSKDLSIPGERIGYAAVHPGAEDAKLLMNGMILCNRILGYVNAPGLMQRVIARVQGQQVDVAIYRRNRDALYEGLAGMGYELARPEGAFYLFPRAPGGDDAGFVQALREQFILAVPSRGFGIPGYFRLAYCVEPQVIERAMPGFRRALDSFRGAAGAGGAPTPHADSR